MSDIFDKKLKEKLRNTLKQVKPIAETSTSSQSIKGNGNTQVGNNQKINQSIDGNDNVQVAGEVVDD
jgi:hypothetical protein